MCPPDAHPVACHQVVVIGGGIAGLTAVKICQDHGIDAHAFEREINLGGVWNHTYKNVRLQQHKDDFRLSGTEWPANVKDFRRQGGRGYVAKFVHEHNLACKVTAGVEVVSAERDEVADEWHVVPPTDARPAPSTLSSPPAPSGSPNSPRRPPPSRTSPARCSTSEYSTRSSSTARMSSSSAGDPPPSRSPSTSPAPRTRPPCLSDRTSTGSSPGTECSDSRCVCAAREGPPRFARNAAARLTFAKFGALDDYGMQPTGRPSTVASSSATSFTRW